jgi:hypothetical protein
MVSLDWQRLNFQATEMFNVMVLTPSTGFTRTAYTNSLIKMFMYFANHRVYSECPNQTIAYDCVEGSGIGANREHLVKKALQTDCTHILFIDEDMSFASDTLHILASRRQPVVACNYPMRFRGSGFTAFSKITNGRIITGPEQSGLEKAFYSGFGFCLIERSVFEKVAKPWFLIAYDTVKEKYTTEDSTFGASLEEANIPWYVDHDASKKVIHLGTYTFNYLDTYKELLEKE